ncbi:Branched-chain amino acid transport protein AzlD [Pseudomonas pohangensis]|uniref:Branched-chain amino acid transport protein AzlD n=1 Tax=Pseudomonas pohangensis TaxID=364197 RepID=A0A1H2F4N5_9PSED|nr:AzlD domain-containing protein [Pseudomonas pohangensis]SDU01908.1 Branched-chain amino acid transport protein AzlD [Pseudomonas pohangensis]
MTDNLYVLGVIVAMALVTLALRALPFVAGQWLQQHPLVHRLGQFLPLAIMTLLLASSTLGAMADDPHSPWPELTAVLLVALLQWFSKNALLSILLGTGVYVLLRNFS